VVFLAQLCERLISYFNRRDDAAAFTAKQIEQDMANGTGGSQSDDEA
jgi:hypothetical protein